MIIFTYFAFLLIILKLILSVILFFNIFTKLKEVIYVSIFLLIVEFFLIIISFFTTKLMIMLPFYLVYNLNYYPYTNILFLIIVFLLLLPYKGIDDNLIYAHKLLVAIYFMLSSLPYLLLF